MSQPSPADVAAAHGVTPPARTKVEPPLEDVDDLPPHLEVVDDVEEILDLVGAAVGSTPPPMVTVHLSRSDRDAQRRVMRELLTWEGAHVTFPPASGRSPRALMRFNITSPQLSVAFDATAVGALAPSEPAAPRWVLDEELQP